jgi:hypothetical protein
MDFRFADRSLPVLGLLNRFNNYAIISPLTRRTPRSLLELVPPPSTFQGLGTPVENVPLDVSSPLQDLGHGIATTKCRDPGLYLLPHT